MHEYDILIRWEYIRICSLHIVNKVLLIFTLFVSFDLH